jgi:hypothetical protein
MSLAKNGVFRLTKSLSESVSSKPAVLMNSEYVNQRMIAISNDMVLVRQSKKKNLNNFLFMFLRFFKVLYISKTVT